MQCWFFERAPPRHQSQSGNQNGRRCTQAQNRRKRNGRKKPRRKRAQEKRMQASNKRAQSCPNGRKQNGRKTARPKRTQAASRQNQVQTDASSNRAHSGPNRRKMARQKRTHAASKRVRPGQNVRKQQAGPLRPKRMQNNKEKPYACKQQPGPLSHRRMQAASGCTQAKPDAKRQGKNTSKQQAGSKRTQAAIEGGAPNKDAHRSRRRRGTKPTRHRSQSDLYRQTKTTKLREKEG